MRESIKIDTAEDGFDIMDPTVNRIDIIKAFEYS
jgi:hypothetical protein